MEIVIFILEMLGLISFAITGALEGIKSKMDLFGVVILGVVTALGGGLIRDLFLGNLPPYTFRHPIYLYIPIITSLTVFIFVYYTNSEHPKPRGKMFEELLLLFDSIGLALFTILGMNVAYDLQNNYSAAFYIFLGLITGVGGGLIRDVLSRKMPYIFVRNVYASASIIGAIIYVFLRRTSINYNLSMIIAMVIIFVIRILSNRLDWHLPVATGRKNESGD